MVSKKHDHRFSWSPQYAAKKIIHVFSFIQPVGSVFTVNLNSNILNYIAEHLKEILQAYRGPMSNPMKFTSGWLSWGIITLSWILTIGGLYKKQSFLIANIQINADNIYLLKHQTICNLFMHQKFLKKCLCLSYRSVHLGHMLIREVSALEQSLARKSVFKRSMTAHIEMP